MKIKNLYYSIYLSVVVVPSAALAASDPFAKADTKFQVFMKWVNDFVPQLVVLAIIIGGVGLMFPKVMRLDASVWKGIIIGAFVIGAATTISNWLT